MRVSVSVFVAIGLAVTVSAAPYYGSRNSTSLAGGCDDPAPTPLSSTVTGYPVDATPSPPASAPVTKYWNVTTPSYPAHSWNYTKPSAPYSALPANGSYNEPPSSKPDSDGVHPPWEVTAPPCIITGGEVASQELRGCLIVGARVVSSRIADSVLLNTDVVTSSLANVSVTGGAIRQSTVTAALLQNVTVAGSTLREVAAQLCTLDSVVLDGASIQGRSTVVGSRGAQVTVQNSAVRDSVFDGATVQSSQVVGGRFEKAAFSTCDSIDRAVLVEVNLQNVVVSNSAIAGANLQDFFLVNTTVEYAMEEAEKTEAKN